MGEWGLHLPLHCGVAGTPEAQVASVTGAHPPRMGDGMAGQPVVAECHSIIEGTGVSLARHHPFSLKAVVAENQIAFYHLPLARPSFTSSFLPPHHGMSPRFIFRHRQRGIGV